MKQNCQLLRGIVQHKNATKPLASKGIHATQALSKEVHNFDLTQGAQKLQIIKV